MFLSGYRKPVDTFAPSLGRFYRTLRDVKLSRQSSQTKYGFSLAGAPRMASGSFEVYEIQAFLELLSTHDVVFDIGANVGFYSCLAASRGKHTIAFEPSNRNLDLLYKNLWTNQFTNVEVFPLGLAGHCGLGRVYGFGGIASFVPGWAQADKSRFCLVPLTTLDTMAAVRFQNQKLLIKMDVEGSERDALAGAVGILDSTPKPTWLIEILLSGEVIPGGINPQFQKTFEVFWERGYRCRMLDSARTQVEATDVIRWVANGFVDSGTHNFLFSAG